MRYVLEVGKKKNEALESAQASPCMGLDPMWVRIQGSFRGLPVKEVLASFLPLLLGCTCTDDSRVPVHWLIGLVGRQERHRPLPETAIHDPKRLLPECAQARTGNLGTVSARAGAALPLPSQ